MEPEATRNVFDGTLLHVAVESWPSGDREVVHHPGACAVVPLTASGDVVLMPLEEAMRAIRDGRIIDAKSVCGLLLVGLERSL